MKLLPLFFSLSVYAGRNKQGEIADGSVLADDAIVADDSTVVDNAVAGDFNCPDGERFQDGYCQRNYCYCNGGQVVDVCLENQTEACQTGTCHQHLTEYTHPDTGNPICRNTCTGNTYISADFTHCINNECFCNNGSAKTQNCETDQKYECEQCYHGYVLSTQLDAGGNEYSECVEITCGPYQYKQNGTCIQNQCYCENGERNTVSCSADGAHECMSCYNHFALNDQNLCELSCTEFEHPVNNGTWCNPNRCECPGGTAPYNCLSHDTIVCDSCQTGFEINPDTGACEIICSEYQRQSDDRQKCINYECLCDNGRPGRCLEDNAISCVQCYYGHYLVDNISGDGTQFCQAKTCTCENGTPQTICPVAEGDYCMSCYAGYKHDNMRCIVDEWYVPPSLDDVDEQATAGGRAFSEDYTEVTYE